MIEPNAVHQGGGSAADRVREGVSGFTRDALELGELQAMLLAEDFGRAKSKIVWGVALLSAAGVLSLAVLTVLLGAAGGGLADALRWPEWAGRLAVSGVALLLLALAAWLGVRMLLKSAEPLGRSSAEFKANWRALKTALTNPSDAAPPGHDGATFREMPPRPPARRFR